MAANPKNVKYPQYGEEIRRLRKESYTRDPTLICEELSVSKEALRKWEVGERLPNRDVLSRLLEILGLSNAEKSRMIEWRNELAAERDGSQAAKFLSTKQIEKVLTEIVDIFSGLLEDVDLEMDTETRVELKCELRKIIKRELGPT